MEEEVVLELASQQVIKCLLGQPEFIEKWQLETTKILEKKMRKEENLEDEGIDLRKPSTSTTSSSSTKQPNPITTSIQTEVFGLTTTIQYVIETFEINVDPRHFFISDTPTSNQNAYSLYDTGQKVEELKNLKMDERNNREKVGNKIGIACRRISQNLKNFGKQFQGQPSLELRSLLHLTHRFCRHFYTISHEIHRFSENFRSRDRKLLKSISQNLEESANEFNLKVAAEIETIEKHMETNQRKQEIRRKPTPVAQSRPTSSVPEYGIYTRRQQRLATSIQQVVGRRQESSNDVMNGFRRPHPPGSIATSIIPKRKGFLMDDNLMKARQRIARITPKTRDVATLNIDKGTPSTDTDDVIMKSAQKMTELVLEDMRKSIKF